MILDTLKWTDYTFKQLTK